MDYRWIAPRKNALGAYGADAVAAEDHRADAVATEAHHWDAMAADAVRANALTRLEAHFTPSLITAEVWGKDTSDLKALAYQLALAPLKDLEDLLDVVLEEIAAYGTKIPWSPWFQNALPTLIKRSGEFRSGVFLMERLHSVFFSQNWTGMGEVYPGYANDIWLTLGQSLLYPETWELWTQKTDPGYCSSAFSSSLFFGLKYVPEAETSSWLTSVTAFAGWQESWFNWLDASHSWLQSKPRNRRSPPTMIDWEGTQSICPMGQTFGDFIPPAKILILSSFKAR